MGLEIERKFLVRNDAWRSTVRRSLSMRQGYLSGESGRASVRIRRDVTDDRRYYNHHLALHPYSTWKNP